MFDEIARVNLSAGIPPKAHGIDRMVKREAVKRLQLQQDDSLLDLGTGFGRVLIESASLCRWLYGIDISRVGLESARRSVAEQGLKNVLLGYGAIEEPSIEINLAAAGVNKMLLLWSLHHLPDELKAEALAGLVKILRRPGRIVIGDIMFFEPPERHRLIWDRIGYDGGVVDRPSRVPYLKEMLENLGGKVEMARLHPLAGVVAAGFG